MTPIAERLRLIAETEFRRVQDEWFFKWHFIGAGTVAEMDNFRGGKIRYGGIKFDGSARIVYWDTIAFYLRQKVGSMFEEVEAAIRDYPDSMRRTAIAECHELVSVFATKVKQAAIETDQKLRGNGFEFPPPDQTHSWPGAEARDIPARADGLCGIYCKADEHVSWVARAENLLEAHRELIGWGAAGITALYGCAKWFFGG